MNYEEGGFMRKFMSVFLIVIALFLMLSSCTSVNNIKLHFMDGDDELNYISFSSDYNIKFPPDPQKEGYIFDGWFTDSSFTTKVIKIDGTTLTEDITLYAKFTKKPENKSCGCKNSSSLIFYTFALIVLGVGILRKKEDL